jgi:signal transduction histidine kinase
MTQEQPHPSLSRDFAKLAFAILCVLLCISLWVSYSIYLKHSSAVDRALETQSSQIEQLIDNEMSHAGHLLESISKQLAYIDYNDPEKIAALLKSFETQQGIYTTFSFVNPSQRLIVSSNHGVLSEPVDVSDRLYIRQAAEKPWHAQIGSPIDGRVSGRRVIPTAMGITDRTGRYIGTLVISIDIDLLMQQIQKFLTPAVSSLLLATHELVPITSYGNETKNLPSDKEGLYQLMSNHSSQTGMLQQGSLLSGSSIFTYYRYLSQSPYAVFIAYDAQEGEDNIRVQLWSRIFQLMGFAIFFILFLWIMRTRMIRPIVEITGAANQLARGQSYHPNLRGASDEIIRLSTEFSRISHYIEEYKRIESELKNKLFALKHQKDLAVIRSQNAMDFLAYTCQHFHPPLTEIISQSQAMKDQLYGPIENRRYRHCANDISRLSNRLLSNVTDLMTFSENQLSMYDVAKSASLSDSITQATTQLSSQLAVLGAQLKVISSTELPLIKLSEFHLLQLITNTVRHFLTSDENRNLCLQVHYNREIKDKKWCALEFYHEQHAPLSSAELSAAMRTTMADHEQDTSETLYLKLVRIIAGKHQLTTQVSKSPDGLVRVVIYFRSEHIDESDTDTKAIV